MRSILFLLAVAASVFSSAVGDEPSESPIFDVLAAEDIVRAKILVDALIEDEDHSDEVLAIIDGFVASARGVVPENASEWERIQAAQRVLYQPGPWNDHRPFSYDHADPLGTKIENKLLSNYLETRLGNCVSMPVLLAIVLEQLGVPVTLGQAPVHAFVIWTNSETGQSINLEATSGGNPARDEWYKQNSTLTPEAMENASTCGRSLRPSATQPLQALMLSTSWPKGGLRRHGV